MSLNLSEVNLFSDNEINEGDLFLYSADFNGSLGKADIEIGSLQDISDNGGIAVILAHKGRHGKDTPHLKDFADYLTGKSRCDVSYFGENNTPAAIGYVGVLEPGDIAIMGNTRMHEGEEKNDTVLAKQFADLVLENDKDARLVVGGPGKAHRKNASNHAIQDFMPAYAAPSIVKEMQIVEPWAGKSGRYSVAVVGGVKGEKIKDGLAGFAETYDVIIPGGIALNTILSVMGKKIGKSVIEDDGKTFEKYAEKILKSNNAHKLCIPDVVRVARKTESGFDGGRWIRIDKENVPDDHMIVDFILPDSAFSALNRVVLEGGRLVVVGTPGVYKEGFKEATDPIIAYSNSSDVDALIMGGDTGSELKSNTRAKIVTVGGAGLHHAAYGTTPVFEKLKENKIKFGAY